MIIMGMVPLEQDREWDIAYAYTRQANKEKGFVVGNYVHIGDCLCEIREVTSDKVNVVGLGWKNKTDCTFTK